MVAGRLKPTGSCWCGCREETGPNSFFLSGHDTKAQARVIRERYGSVPEFLIEHGYGPEDEQPSVIAETDNAPWQDMEEGMGFKRLTPENWMEPDSIMRAFVHGALSGEPYVPTGEERVQEIMSIELSDDVPYEVRRLFAAVRGALCYGYFYYPLYTLASEQISRIAETAVARKYEALGGPRPQKTSFKGKLDYLQDKGLITDGDVVWWNAIRELRNSASHPHDHRAQDPGMARGRAENLAERINELFAS